MIFCWILGWFLDHFWLQNSMKKRLIFLLFFWWIFIDFWDAFWEPNRIKKSMEFMTPFSVNFYGFWIIFWWILGSKTCGESVAKMSRIPRGSPRGSQDPQRLPFGWLGLPFWATLVPLGSPNGAKTVPNPSKIWSFFGSIFGCDFDPKMVPKMAPKTNLKSIKNQSKTESGLKNVIF